MENKTTTTTSKTTTKTELEKIRELKEKYNAVIKKKVRTAENIGTKILLLAELIDKAKEIREKAEKGCGKEIKVGIGETYCGMNFTCNGIPYGRCYCETHKEIIKLAKEIEG